MIIEAAIFLQIAKECGAGVPPAILAGVNRKESQYNALALNVNKNGKGNTVHGITTLAQAKAKARQLIDSGQSFDAGIMQINHTNWGWLGLTIDNVFDPCTNINAAGRLLNSLGKYNAGNAQRGIQNGYAGSAWQHIQSVSRETPAEASCDQSHSQGVDWEDWAQARRGTQCSRVSFRSVKWDDWK